MPIALTASLRQTARPPGQPATAALGSAQPRSECGTTCCEVHLDADWLERHDSPTRLTGASRPPAFTGLLLRESAGDPRPWSGGIVRHRFVDQVENSRNCTAWCCWRSDARPALSPCSPARTRRRPRDLWGAYGRIRSDRPDHVPTMCPRPSDCPPRVCDHRSRSSSVIDVALAIADRQAHR